MGLAVLGPGPTELRHWLPRQGPPTVSNVFGSHCADFARTLTREQYQLQRGTCHQSGVVECWPHPRQFCVRQYSLAALGRVARYMAAWIKLDVADVFLDGPCEYGAGGGECLVGDS